MVFDQQSVDNWLIKGYNGAADLLAIFAEKGGILSNQDKYVIKEILHLMKITAEYKFNKTDPNKENPLKHFLEMLYNLTQIVYYRQIDLDIRNLDHSLMANFRVAHQKILGSARKLGVINE